MLDETEKNIKAIRGFGDDNVFNHQMLNMTIIPPAVSLSANCLLFIFYAKISKQTI